MAKTTVPETPQAVAVPLSSVLPADWNPRSVSDECFQNLCRSIETDPEFILATKDGTIFAGNMRGIAPLNTGAGPISPPSSSTSPCSSSEHGVQ